MSTSLAILRERGPMTLRELTRATSVEMDCRQLYLDVDAVMHRHLEDGEVTLVEDGQDFREDRWAAASEGEGLVSMAAKIDAAADHPDPCPVCGDDLQLIDRAGHMWDEHGQ